MDVRTTLKNRVNRGGFCVAAFYFLVVVVVFVFTADNTKPDDVSYDWIPFILLFCAMVWD